MAVLESLPTVFDPVLYSIEANTWLIAHLGESPQQATMQGVPMGVDRNALTALDELYRLDQAAQATGQTWAGFEAVRQAAQTYLDQLQKWEANYQQQVRRDPNYPRYPTMCTWDSFGRYHRGGVGSDAGRVSSYFDSNGDRQKLAIMLQPESTTHDIPEWQRGLPKPKVYTDLIENDEKGFWECPICAFRESYEPMSSTSRNQSRSKMGKHLANAKSEKDLHKQLHTYAFGSH